MGSGKSLDLLRSAHSYEEAGRDILIAKPETDTKAGELVSTRLKVGEIALTRQPDLLVTQSTDLEKEVLSLRHARQMDLAMIADQGDETIFNYDALLVDEAQFLSPDHVNQLRRIATMGNISVIAYGLLTDFQTKLFPGSQRLIELSDVHEVLITICRCGSQARFNTRKINGVFTFEGDQVAIDGKSSVEYVALCSRDYEYEKSRWLADQKSQQYNKQI